MNSFPPRAELARIVISLAKHLPLDLGSLLRAARFDAERQTVSRLADPAYAWAAARSMSEPEASWLSSVLLERWAEVAVVMLEPFAAILAPERVWIVRGANTLRLQVAVDGLDEGFTLRWSGSGLDDPPRTQAVVECPLPFDEGLPRSDLYARVLVDGHALGKRVLLVDEVKIRVSVPVLIVSDDRTQLVFHDHLERRAVESNVRLGQMDYRTDRHGTLRLESPAEPGSAVYIEGTLAGRVPHGSNSAGDRAQRE